MCGFVNEYILKIKEKLCTLTLCVSGLGLGVGGEAKYMHCAKMSMFTDRPNLFPQRLNIPKLLSYDPKCRYPYTP